MANAYTSHMYRKIGQGHCGTVWALPDDVYAIKRRDGSLSRDLHNDYEMHLRIIEDLTQHPLFTPLAIPQCHAFIQNTGQAW
jgi:hypothetical protein